MPTPGFTAFVARIALALAVLLTPSLGWANAPKSCDYEVSSGDTVGHIALRQGISQDELLRLNPRLRSDPDALRVGQTLKVCKVGSASHAKQRRAKPKRCGHGGHIVRHEVGQGDTLTGIAERHGVREEAILARNRALAAKPDLLRIGQVVEICVEPAPKPQRTRRAAKAKECGFETPLFEHEVVPGEHLAQIAGRYGVRRGDLVRLNAFLRANPDRLRVGQTIRVCPEISPRERDRITHTVVSGENIGKIAIRYGLSPQELVRYQQGALPDPNALREGQKLAVWVDGAIVNGFAGRDTDTGSLRGGTQLPGGRHYVVKRQASAWGTPKTVRAIQTAVANYRRRVKGGPKVHIGDISRRGGGKFPPHISHQHGRDVDVGYVLRGDDAHETKFRGANGRNLDVARTWALVKAFLDTNQVTYIFMDYRVQKLLFDHAHAIGVDDSTLEELFQYPRGRGRSHGVIRHWRGHANHFHVRFRP